MMEKRDEREVEEKKTKGRQGGKEKDARVGQTQVNEQKSMREGR